MQDMNKTPNTEQNRNSSPADEWQDLLETPEVMSSSASPNSRDIPAPADYPWEIDSNSSSSSSSSQKLYLIVEEKNTVQVAASTSTKKFHWKWTITNSSGETSSGEGEFCTAQHVSDNIKTLAGISARLSTDGPDNLRAGESLTIAFASPDENGVWKPNGWKVTAFRYEVLGIDKDGYTALTNNQKIPAGAKPIKEDNTYGITTFLAKLLDDARDKENYDHWYSLDPIQMN